MNTDEAIDTVVGLAKAFLVMNDNLQEGIKVQPNRLPKVEEAIKVLEGLKPSNIIDEVFDNEMNARKKRLLDWRRPEPLRMQLCGKHEHPKYYVPFPDEIDGGTAQIPHPD